MKSLPIPIYLRCIINWNKGIIDKRKRIFKKNENLFNDRTRKHFQNLNSDRVILVCDVWDNHDYAIMLDHSVEYRIFPHKCFCECKKWSNLRLPCIHLKALLQSRINSESLENYIDEIYWIIYIKQVFNSIDFIVLPNRKYKQTNIFNPKYLRLRKRKARIKGVDETANKRVKE